MRECRELTNLVNVHGWWKVYETGLRLFGYPPTWEPSLSELLQLKNLLESEN